jgi:16S rRNA (guanine527-N7)-methyltransferase
VVALSWTVSSQDLARASRVLRTICEGLGVEPPASADVRDVRDLRVWAGAQTYLELLGQWNERINLTAVREGGAALERHVVDSLVAAAFVPREARTLVDVGSGAGLPGLFIALARPDLDVTLVESLHKKCAFLNAAKRALGLTRVNVVADRAERLVNTAGGQGAFDCAISRATLDLPAWLTLGGQLVRAPNGVVLGMEGGQERALPAGAIRHRYRLGDADLAIVVVRS